MKGRTNWGYSETISFLIQSIRQLLYYDPIFPGREADIVKTLSTLLAEQMTSNSPRGIWDLSQAEVALLTSMMNTRTYISSKQVALKAKLVACESGKARRTAVNIA